MNQAFSKNGFNNVLFAKKGSQEVNDIYDFYGVDNSFPIKFYRTPSTIKGSSIISIVEIVFYLLKVKRENTIIYGRDIYGVMISWLMGFEVIYESHGIPYSRVVKYLEKWLLSRKKNVTFIVISEALKKMYRQFFEGNYKVNVCHDASDIPQIIYKNNSLNEIFNNKKINIGYIGHLYKGRGIDIVMKLAEKLTKFDFHIVGGEKSDIDYWSNKNNSSSNVFFHGFVSPRETIDFRNNFDILLMPYQIGLGISGKKIDTSSWMSPMKLFEYMSAQKPIISSDLPVLREILNESNSILVESNNISLWQSAIELLVSDEGLRNKIAEQAYQDFKLKYTWDKRAQKILNIINL